MALRFLSAEGGGTTSDAVRALNYAVLMGAHLSSNSWGGGGFSHALYDAIAAARDADQLFVAAAGNDGGSTDTSGTIPRATTSTTSSPSPPPTRPTPWRASPTTAPCPSISRLRA